MYLDKMLLFEDSDSVINASRASTNVIDLGTADLGKSDPLEIYVRVSEAFNNLTSLTIKAQTDDAAGFGAAVDLPVAETVLQAGLALNKEVFKVRLPLGVKRYMRLYYTVAGTAPTTGRLQAGLALDRQTNP